MALDPYEQLGVERSATVDEIKTAWRSKVQKMHPDKHPDDPHAATRYELIRESYEILSDPARRSAYDKGGETEVDDLPERARAFLEATAIGLIGQAQEAGALGKLNLVELLISGIGRMKADRMGGRFKELRAVDGLQKQLKRVRRKGKGENLLAVLIEVRIDEARARAHQFERAVQECDAAVAMLSDYEDIDLQEQLRIGARVYT